MAPSKEPTFVAPHLQGYPELRYCKVRSFDKKPFEDGWNKPANVYTYDAAPLVNWITNQSGNYGVCCGYGDLLVLDVDEHERLRELGILELLPKTYTVRSRSGGFHFYYFCHDWKEKKILYDLIINGKPGKDDTVKALHLGELQWKGVQVVGPNSCYRNEEDPENMVLQYWREENQLPITTVTEEELLNILAGKVKYNSRKNEPMVAPEIAPVAPVPFLPGSPATSTITLQAPKKNTVVAAIRALKSVCLGSDIKDNVGFSRWDLDNAGNLINKACSDEMLSYGEESRAYRMLKKYHKQLSKLGIPYDSIGLLTRPKRLRDSVKSMVYDLNKQIKIEDHAMPANPVVKPDENIQGSHPIHGSSRDEEKKGYNFSIVPSTATGKKKNCFHCFRCDSGGGVLEWIAIQSGIIECENAKKGCLIGKEDALEKAIRDLGYDLPERECEMKEGEVGLREHVDLVVGRLAYVNEINPQLFIYRGKLARVLEDGTIEEITRDGLPEIIDRAVRFYYMTGGEVSHRVNTYPPRELVGAILARGQWPGLPELAAVSKGPIVRKDFSICSTPGFDAETGIYYIGEKIELPAKVSLSLAFGAALKLDKSLFSGFNFKDDASHANAWALIMMGLLRRLFKKVPAFAISKPDVASGASTLSTMPAYIMQGNEGALLGKQRKSDAGIEETKKRVDTALLAGEKFVIADNETSMEDDYYNTLITADEIALRPLGKSKLVRVKNDYMLIFNGKHLSFTDDTARRAVLIELEPNNIKSFNFDLNRELLLHRDEVLYHLLLIIRAWKQAGGYVPLDEEGKEIKKAGDQLVSFREAIKVIDSILQFIDVPDAFTNADKARNESNPDREMWESCFVQWAYTLHDGKIASESLAEKLRKLEMYLPPKLLDAVTRNDSGKIGYLLRTHKDRPYGDGLTLRNAKIGKIRYWWMEIPKLVFDEYCPEMPKTTIAHRHQSLPPKLSSPEDTPA